MIELAQLATVAALSLAAGIAISRAIGRIIT